MKIIPVQQIVDDCRMYADQINSTFRDDDQILRMINQKGASLYDLLLESAGAFRFIDGYSFTVESGDALYTLPDEFYRLYSVTLEWSETNRENLLPIRSINERTRLKNNNNWQQYGEKYFNIRGNQNGEQVIEFLPTPRSTVTCSIEFVPTFQDLELEGNYDSINGFDKLLSLGVAIELKDQEEEGYSSALQGLYAQEEARIQKIIDKQQMEHTHKIRNVADENLYNNNWFPGGHYFYDLD